MSVDVRSKVWDPPDVLEEGARDDPGSEQILRRFFVHLAECPPRRGDACVVMRFRCTSTATLAKSSFVARPPKTLDPTDLAPETTARRMCQQLALRGIHARIASMDENPFLFSVIAET